jgi:hypothetical protein
MDEDAAVELAKEIEAENRGNQKVCKVERFEVTTAGRKDAYKIHARIQDMEVVISTRKNWDTKKKELAAWKKFKEATKKPTPRPISIG